MRVFVLTVLLTAGLSSVAFAEYFLDSPDGYRLAPPAPDQRLLIARSNVLLEAAAECTGVQLDGLLEIQGGMSRFIELDRSVSIDRPAVRELVLTPAAQRKATGAAPVRYQIDGAPIYLGFGRTRSDGYDDYMMVTVSGDLDAGLAELDRFSLSAPYCGGIYALDLTGDGVTELAIPYSTGAGGGGGIEVRAMVPTGGLAWFGNDELDSTLFSQTGYINLLDYDGDGDWEIETMAPVLCSACGYMWNDLWTFDAESWNWETDAQKFAAYYKPQRDFYSALNSAVQKLAARPADLAYSGSAIDAKYATQIAGQWYSLDVFMPDGRLDKTWVSQLKALVDGWR